MRHIDFRNKPSRFFGQQGVGSIAARLTFGPICLVIGAGLLVLVIVLVRREGQLTAELNAAMRLWRSTWVCYQCGTRWIPNG
jgi:sensor c-di-GMP phosphodiesterase-like protein